MGLRRMIINWLMKEELENCGQPSTKVRALGIPKYSNEVCCDSSDSTNPRPETSEMLNFRVYSAVGSYIVEFHRYDRHKDERKTALYTISHDDNFGEQIARISAAEIIKQ